MTQNERDSIMADIAEAMRKLVAIRDAEFDGLKPHQVSRAAFVAMQSLERVGDRLCEPRQPARS